MDLDDEIPGLGEAREQETAARTEAFLDVPRILCGIEVVPLTLERLAVLRAASSPFICGGVPAMADIGIFLWVVSPEFGVRDDEGRAVFVAQLREVPDLLDVVACVGQIREFMDEMLQDAPAGGGGRSDVPITCSEATFAHLFGKAYGWTADQTMREKLPRLYQLLRLITRDADPKAQFISRSDKVRGKWQRARKAAMDAAAAVDMPTGA